MQITTTILKTIKNILIAHIVDAMSIIAVCVVIFSGCKMYPELVILDVGQGDAILIQQDSFQVLIDGGPSNTVLFEISKYMPVGDRDIEVVVLTHPHADHIDGLLWVLDRYEVGEVWVNTVEYDTNAYIHFNSLDLNFREVYLGTNLSYKDILLEVIYPFEKDDGTESNVNNESIVIKADLNGSVIYLTGDAESEVELELLSKGLVQEGEILKAGHHCSNSSTARNLLDAVNPDIAICSCGEGNRFGHPHNETIEKFVSSHVQYMTTMEEGNIKFEFKE